MPDYSIFGGRLRSDLEFPELQRSSAGAPEWTIISSTHATESADDELLGDDAVDGSVRVRLYRSGAGFRLEYDDTGSFAISANGSRITWNPAADASTECARLDIIGRVLATALHARGVMTLHGSAVEIDGAAIAFLGPKFHGKSTLSMALTGAGARLLTDDTLPVEAGEPPLAWPGVHSVRLFADAAGRLRGSEVVGDPFQVKETITELGEDRLMFERVQLAAIYQLTPVDQSVARASVEREMLSAVPSTMVLVRHSKLAPLLGKTEAPVLFQQALAMARAVPVFELRVVRDFDQLPDVVSRLLEWHSSSLVHDATGAT